MFYWLGGAHGQRREAGWSQCYILMLGHFSKNLRKKKNVLKSKRGVIADEYSYQEPIKIITDDDLTCGFG